MDENQLKKIESILKKKDLLDRKVFKICGEEKLPKKYNKNQHSKKYYSKNKPTKTYLKSKQHIDDYVEYHDFNQNYLLEAPKQKNKNIKRKRKTPQQIYDQLNRNSCVSTIQKYKNKALTPEPFKPPIDQVDTLESVSVQTPVILKRGNDYVYDRMYYYKCFVNSKLQHQYFQGWVKKFNRKQIKDMKEQLADALCRKIEKNKKRRNESSTDSEIDADLPPIYDDFS